MTPAKPLKDLEAKTRAPEPVDLHGEELLNDPLHNKGTAFTAEQRKKYGLEGLLPAAVEGLDRQVQRVLTHLDAKQSDLERYIYLIALSDQNETLFYRTVMSDPARFIPILYDPTVAEACLAFGHIYRRPRGMYITRQMKGRIAQVLRNWPVRDVRTICVSTGGRILGLGDIGANGMGIPIGKLQLYTACAAVPPDSTLPVLLDIGTSNAKLRADPLYLGLREPPPSEQELDALTDEFVAAVQEVFPGCLIHFEDWKGTDAVRILKRYRDKVLCFNDDIQGTASIVLAGPRRCRSSARRSPTSACCSWAPARRGSVSAICWSRRSRRKGCHSPTPGHGSPCSTSTASSSRRAPISARTRRCLRTRRPPRRTSSRRSSDSSRQSSSA